MISSATTKYQKLADEAIEEAEFKFEAVLVDVRKNVLLLRKKASTFSDKPFLTIKINFHQMNFFDGNYDMSLESAVDNFRDRVSQSGFSEKLDIPD